MGVNSKAIEKIDQQIRMLDEDYEYNSENSTYLDDYSDDDSTTIKIDKIDDLDDVEMLDDESSTESDTSKIDQLDEINEDNEEDGVAVNKEDVPEESEEGVNIFLIYYIGIILIAIILLVIIYFLFT